MGNADLRELAAIDEIAIERISDKRAAVDAHNWLYKYMTTFYQYRSKSEYTDKYGNEKPALLGSIVGLQRFFEYNISPLFVFDGTTRDEKQQEIEKRKQNKIKAKEKAEQARKEGDNILAAKYESRSQYLDEESIMDVKRILDNMDITYYDAPRSADEQVAYIVQNEDAEYSISDDYDCLLFGSPFTVRNFTSSSRPLEEIVFEKTLIENNITHKQLVDVAILCGTDYNEGVYGYGIKTALKAIQNKESIEDIFNSEDGKDINKIEKLRSIFLEKEVGDDYPIPSQPDPDIQSVREYVDDIGLTSDSIKDSLLSIEQELQERKQGRLNEF